MRAITIGDRTYRVIVTPRDGNWIARAEHTDSNDPFGVECSGATETAAVERLIEWLTWQSEHSAALEALQQAQRAYHRTIAGSAFANPIDGPSAIELQKESLEQVETARRRLDEIRARKPS